MWHHIGAGILWVLFVLILHALPKTVLFFAVLVTVKWAAEALGNFRAERITRECQQREQERIEEVKRKEIEAEEERQKLYFDPLASPSKARRRGLRDTSSRPETPLSLESIEDSSTEKVDEPTHQEQLPCECEVEPGIPSIPCTCEHDLNKHVTIQTEKQDESPLTSPFLSPSSSLPNSRPSSPPPVADAGSIASASSATEEPAKAPPAVSSATAESSSSAAAVGEPYKVPHPTAASMRQHVLFICTKCRYALNKNVPLTARDLVDIEELAAPFTTGLRLYKNVLERRQQLLDQHAQRTAEDKCCDEGSLLAQLRVEPVECLSTCYRANAIAFACPGKYTYQFGDLDPRDSADEILQFAQFYMASKDGFSKTKMRPKKLKEGILARVPPLESLPVLTEPPTDSAMLTKAANIALTPSATASSQESASTEAKTEPITVQRVRSGSKLLASSSTMW